MNDKPTLDPSSAILDADGNPSPKRTPIHEFCTVCGWRKGGVDSWDGQRCKCGHSGPVIYYREWPQEGGWVR